jgi:hypothetical protein
MKARRTHPCATGLARQHLDVRPVSDDAEVGHKESFVILFAAHWPLKAPKQSELACHALLLQCFPVEGSCEQTEAGSTAPVKLPSAPPRPILMLSVCGFQVKAAHALAFQCERQGEHGAPIVLEPLALKDVRNSANHIPRSGREERRGQILNSATKCERYKLEPKNCEL